jgi:hypothetical protein
MNLFVRICRFSSLQVARVLIPTEIKSSVLTMAELTYICESFSKVRRCEFMWIVFFFSAYVFIALFSLCTFV